MTDYLIEVVATNRHKQITIWLREECLNIDHKYEPWHFSNDIKAIFKVLAKENRMKSYPRVDKI